MILIKPIKLISPIRPIRHIGRIGLISLIGFIGLIGAPLAPLAARASTINAIPTARLNQGLVGYWSFDGNTIANGAIRDLSGNGNTGYPTNISTSTFYASGKIGQGGNFDGVNDKITFPAFSFATNIATISFWAKCDPASSKSYKPTVMKFDGTNSRIDSGFSQPCTSLYTVFSDGGSNTGSNLYVTGRNFTGWNHFSFVISSNVIKVYVNGAQASSYNYSASLSTIASVLTLGYRGSSDYLSGGMDDVRIYNRALSPAEVNALYKMGQATINKIPTVRLNRGLAGYWSFDGNSVANGVVQDLSGNRNTLNLSGVGGNAFATSTFYSPGKIGQGAYFNGLELASTTGTNLNFDGTQSFSVSGWVKLDKNIPDFKGVAGKASSSSADGYFLLYNNNGNLGCKVDGVDFGSASIVSASDSRNNKWHHLLMTVDRGSQLLSCYLDGVSVGTPQSIASVGTFINSYPFTIGSLNSGVRFLGSVDDVRVYNRVLSVAEIKALYQMGGASINKTPVNRLNQGLVGYWTFDGKDVVNGAIRDISGNGNTGYPVNISTSTFYYMGKIGQGLNFDGVNDYVGSFSNLTSIKNAPQASVSGWIYIKSKVTDPASFGNHLYFESTNGDATASRISLGLNSNTTNIKLSARTSSGDTGQTVTSTTNLSLNKWYHVVGIVDYANGQGYIYINGQFDKQGSMTFGATKVENANSSRINLGARNNGGSGTFWNGSLDDIRIYNRALSSAEVRQLYNMGR